MHVKGYSILCGWEYGRGVKRGSVRVCCGLVSYKGGWRYQRWLLSTFLFRYSNREGTLAKRGSPGSLPQGEHEDQRLCSQRNETLCDAPKVMNGLESWLTR